VPAAHKPPDNIGAGLLNPALKKAGELILNRDSSANSRQRAPG